MTLLRNFFLSIALLATTAIAAQSSAVRPDNDSISEVTDMFDLDLGQNIATPKVNAKFHDAIKDYMHAQARTFQKNGYKVETMRRGEVIVVTIPTDELFLPNDTVVMARAAKLLDRIVPYVNAPDTYKVIVTAHCDNTGTESYQQWLTEARIYAVYDWMDTHARSTASLVGYPMGASEPLKDNNSRAGRAENRRLEFFIVPNTGLIQLAKDKRL